MGEEDAPRWAVCFVGVGANVGDAAATINQAAAALARHPRVREFRVSPLYRTRPVGPVPQPDFHNGVFCFATDLAPLALLGVLHAIEARYGRERLVHWGPRTLDLDLLFYGAAVFDLPGLTVPHPRIAERGFVLRPLHDLAPALRHPRTGATVADMVAAWAGATPEADVAVRPLGGDVGAA